MSSRAKSMDLDLAVIPSEVEGSARLVTWCMQRRCDQPAKQLVCLTVGDVGLDFWQ
jgi:hypothetical protein